ncbi:MAG: hypothetical protein KKF65_01115 [Nanoarchaeota archaeon]|nr:hypothetical protein [Nanoarchaeota archaeon]
MQTRIIATTGEQELEQQINNFIKGRNIVDIKLTEWVNYSNKTGGYSALIMYEDGVPTRQVQVKIFAATSETVLEQQLNGFILGKQVVDVKFTEWVEYEAETGGYTALIIYVSQPGFQATPQPVRQVNTPKSAPQYDVL